MLKTHGPKHKRESYMAPCAPLVHPCRRCFGWSMQTMITPDDLSLMTEQEKLDFIQRVSEAEEWQICFEPIYAHLMDDESPRVREEAVMGLGDLAEPRHLEAIMRKAESDPSVDVRAKATSVLGVFIYEGATVLDESRGAAVRRFLLDTANDPDQPLLVRRMAIEALSFDADDEVHDLIDWAYHHAAIEVRMSAIFAMGRSQSTRWHDAVLAEMDSDNANLRREAVCAAGEACLIEATPKLRALASHADLDTRLSAIWSLGHAGGPGALETLEMCAQSGEDEVRRVAREAIAEYRYLARREENNALESYDDYAGE